MFALHNTEYILISAITTKISDQALGGLFRVSGGLDLVVNQVGNVVYEEIEKEQESKS